ncbi:tRNA dihydrouridine(20/20a) synthase DusA [Falsirhodobacter halotolerans]|nr:tRNA dihydrouridine(20/20a) synthase DusA [Falsirhodobacter halotolerans]
MINWTDRHCRFFHRQITRHARLFTEMVVDQAIIHGPRDRLLGFHPAEHPVALQIGGSEPEVLARAVRIANDYGYDEINLNVGCPSDRVQSGCFGAVLMKYPARVSDCLIAMREAARVPVSVKCRIGVDDQTPEEVLPHFLQMVSDTGIRQVTIHARKAWLKGLSPKENREIPPLDYPLVFHMKAEFPDLSIALNGGVQTLDDARRLIDRGVDGVMIGRAAYHDPMSVLAGADTLWGGAATVAPAEVVARMRPYIEDHLREGGRLHQITRHMLGLYTNRPGARLWRRILSEHATRDDAGWDVMDAALAAVEP